MEKKSSASNQTCSDCIHHWACAAWNIGEIGSMDGTHCANFERWGSDRLRELAEADRDGRLVVMPCKENAKLVYDGFEWNADHWNIRLTATRGADAPAGYTVRLLDIEQAESALRGEER